MASIDRPDQLIADTARKAGADMVRASAALQDGQKISIPAQEFHLLGQMLVALSELATRAPACDGNCMGAPIDGIRFWTPIDVLEAERARVRDLERQLRDQRRLPRGNDWLDAMIADGVPPRPRKRAA